MKVLLYNNEEIVNFVLPKEINGSFSFDADINEEQKLINIEERKGKWTLYSTASSKIIDKFDNNFSNITFQEEVCLEEFSYYYLFRSNILYLIYIQPTLEEYKYYKYNENLNLSISNDNTNSSSIISYYPNIAEKFVASICFKDGKIYLENNCKLIYLNNLKLDNNSTLIDIGDELNIYGLKVLFLNQLICVQNIPDKMNVVGLEDYKFLEDSLPRNVDVIDRNLYTSDQYFSKSPRFRRIIEEKKINLASPPNDVESNKMPFILTVGPMLTMGITSCTMLFSQLVQLSNGQSTLEKSWPQLLSGGAMLASMLLWPSLIRVYNKKQEKIQQKVIEEKYQGYLNEKRIDLNAIKKEQYDIMLENLIDISTCIGYLNRRGLNFWDKRNDQNDFLTVRLGIGNAPLKIDISYTEEEFTIEESNLRNKADELVREYKYVENSPVSYSFFENTVTAVMGYGKKIYPFTNNIVLQLMTFYSYEDLKFVVFTTSRNEDKWNYIKYLNHNFSNDKNFRFFSTNLNSARILCDYLMQEINNRIGLDGQNNEQTILVKPQYFIIVDGYNQVKHFDLINRLAEIEKNIGFSILILEERLSNLPSKCKNFINLGDPNSGILKNSFDNQEIIGFHDEINYQINYMDLVRKISNIPIEFEEKVGSLPDSISFMEMENVGKVEQLNILNRWNTNDSTSSLKAEVGVDENGDLMYLDLHEKFHGPHGLIAGTTGSGKSEFIITYILSMAINYSPDDVAFILIDYKGGGLTGAFENRTTGVTLPHLVGTITNLDKAEMDRTLVSIDSEVKRRQAKFNEARDMLNESTIDIYKYQRFYKEGKLKEPIPHLFIISDEFAELKSQQPEFMDNLISIARIGRSLGVHLILATQKPSGVVNEQIWSNSKFKVCLKVQDEADSKEMIKRPDAAHIKEAGRFFLQVGYDEYFAKGQSGYCGAKYYPSDTIVKSIDKSINFIDDCGRHIKSMQAGSGMKKEANGEQIAAIMKNIISIANKENKVSKRLWLENIPEIILESELEKKYNVVPVDNDVVAILGEYDAPESQKQDIVVYDLLNDGNTIIYGNDSFESEMLLEVLLYSTIKNYSSSKINYYIIDYGSETLRKFNKLPHVGGSVYQGEDEKFSNLMKLIKEEIDTRKKLFSDFGGEYKQFSKKFPDKLPLFTVIMNNYDSINENNKNLFEELPELVRDSERYGIIFIITAISASSVYRKVSQNFNHYYALKLKDYSDYMEIFGTRKRLVPRDLVGRGICQVGEIHEFQVSSIVSNRDDLSNFILTFVQQKQNENQLRAKKIPALPNIVGIDDLNVNQISLSNIPIGISKKDLTTQFINLKNDIGFVVSSNKIGNMSIFVRSLLGLLINIPSIPIMILDGLKNLNLDTKLYPNYYTQDFDKVITELNSYVENLIKNNSVQEGVIVIYGVSKILSKLDNSKILQTLTGNLKKYEHIGIFIVEEFNKLKTYNMEIWFKNVFNTSSGLWIGRGLAEQSLFRISALNKEMMANYNNDMGFVINDNLATLSKLIDFITQEDVNE